MPVRVLHLVTSFGPKALGGAASRLIPALPHERVVSHVINLGGKPFFEPPAGTIHHFFRYRFDLACLYAVRRSVREIQPDVVHAWGPLATRVAAFLPEGRFVVSHADRACDPLTNRCLRRTDHVIVANEAEKRRYVRMSVPTSSIRVIPPGIPDPIPANRLDILASLSLPETARYLIASGHFDQNAGLKYAVWAFDIVRYLHPNLHLVLLGDGPERPRVESFSRKLGQSGFVQYPGFRRDACEIIAHADAAWVTHAIGGTSVAAEARVAGVPVFAFATDDTASVRDSGVTLVTRNDPVALATATHAALTNPGPRSAAHFPMSALASAHAAVYDGQTDA
jgi:glycosyltransferase involved in cell wall biosynthesis